MPTPPNFAAALTRTLGWEGGYSNDSADHGGETYCGISRRAWPAWAGWAQVDRATAGKPAPAVRDAILAADPTLRNTVEEFYRSQFWLPLRANVWQDGALAADVFDAAVNMGLPTAVKLVQKAAGMAPVACDGQVGPATLAVLSTAPAGLQARFAALRALRYGEIAAHDHSQAVWLPSWLGRALAALLG